VTDTANPVTGSQLTPMFATGAHGTGAPNTLATNTLATNTLATNTEPHSAPIFDTGPHPLPLGAEEPVRAEEPEPQEFSEPVDVSPRSVPARPVVVPGSYQFVSRWRFALILIGVWAVSAAAGLGLYHWWYTALDKTVPVAGILGYLIVCMVASLLISLVPDRPRVTALAIVLMAAPLASTAAAAILHGAYYFEWIARPAIG
jgi:hypothetical protein